MKIAMVSEHASPLATLGGPDAGGQNVHVAELAAALAAVGHEVTVHTRRDDPGRPHRVALRPGVLVEHDAGGPARPLGRDRLHPYMDEFGDNLRRAWDEDPPDVVHAHFWMSGLAALRAARHFPALPVVQTFHALGAVKRRHQGSADTSPHERIDAERMIADRADAVIATCSDEVFELVRQGVNRRSVAVVPCGVDVAALQPDADARCARGATRPNRVLVLGRLVPRKGADDVIRALPGLSGTELVIAGGPPAGALDGDPDARRLRRLARELGVADRVRLTGGVDRDRVGRLLAGADAVVCVPWYEPFGIVPLEAMACGVPVVAAAVGGLTDTVVDGVTGVHVPPRDPDTLAAALAGLLADPERRERMGRAGRRRAAARYSWQRVAADTAKVYERLLAPRATRSSRRPGEDAGAAASGELSSAVGGAR